MKDKNNKYKLRGICGFKNGRLVSFEKRDLRKRFMAYYLPDVVPLYFPCEIEATILKTKRKINGRNK